MRCSVEKFGDSTFLKVQLVAVNQKGNSFFISKIPSALLLQVFTVRPAQYDIVKNTDLANSFPDEKEYYTHLITQDRKVIENRDFQRNMMMDE